MKERTLASVPIIAAVSFAPPLAASTAGAKATKASPRGVAAGGLERQPMQGPARAQA